MLARVQSHRIALTFVWSEPQRLATIGNMKTIHCIVLVSFACITTALAVDPPPDGGYPNQNTAEGDDALLNLTTGTDNTALGFNALLSDTTGYFNTAVGSQALLSNTTGGNNVAIGAQALFSNQTAYSNVAIGYQALYEDTSSGFNIAIGALALYSNTAIDNVAIGNLAARTNTTGVENTVVGFAAMYANQTGSNNCAFGGQALTINLEGSNNTAIGTEALSGNFGNNNTAIGAFAGDLIEAGNNNIFIGVSAGGSIQGGSNNIEIGAMGKRGDEGDIRIGTKGVHTAVHIAGVYGRTVPDGVAVVTDNRGHLGTVTSSARFKEAIKPMDKASEAILALKPVTFRYKPELGPDGIPQFGLVAEQVEMVNPDLVVRDDDGKPYSVRYEAVNAMLLNEFLKEHRKGEQRDRKIEKLESTVVTLKAALAEQKKKVEALTTGLEKVSAELEPKKTAPQMVVNNQ
jgi:trimeric autotransporter adhesin